LAEQGGVYGALTFEHPAAVLEVCKQMLTELQSYDTLDLAMLSAGMREVGNHLMR
jgi:glutamate dehydrogenase